VQKQQARGATDRKKARKATKEKWEGHRGVRAGEAAGKCGGIRLERKKRVGEGQGNSEGVS